MRLLNKEDILKNRVDTISQYHILDYLKKNLNIDEFKIYLVDPVQACHLVATRDMDYLL